MRRLPTSTAERLRWWIGELLVEMGRPREAERYFRSVGANPWAAYELAKIYEELGEYQKARDAYALVAAAWREADPELRPRAEEARAAVARLTSVVREP